MVLPALAQAQTLAGTVRDASGGVLPGVTVEAESPVLIERVRSTVTDGNGQYQVVQLRPGTYTVTFSLPGFQTVRRESVEVSGAVVTINADMRVGSVEETITVVGETPVVDVQSARRVVTVSGDTVNSIPIGRGYGNILATVPGIELAGAGSTTSATGRASSFFTSNGGPSNEGRVQIAGMNVGSSFNGGGVADFLYDVTNTQEIQVTVSGGLGEADTGGPAMNLIPREGGNRFSTNVFGSTAGEWSQGNNIDDRLRGFGINEPPALIKSWDTSASVGGPILRDRIWFYGTVRDMGDHTNIVNARGNLNTGDPTAWIAAPDENTQLRNASSKQQIAIRLTGQITPRNKVGFYHDYNFACTGSGLAQGASYCREPGSDWIALGGTTTAPEAGSSWDDREKIIQATYSSTVTNRLLVEAGYSMFTSRWGGQLPAGHLADFIPVVEQSAFYGSAFGYTYRGLNTRSGNDQKPNTWRGSASYVTGAHNIKIGTQGAYHIQKAFTDRGPQGIQYRFNSPCTLNPDQPAGTLCRWNTGTIVPTVNQFTIGIPNYQHNVTTFHAFYAQDSWTRDRLTLQGALRYEYARSWHPEGGNGVIYGRPGGTPQGPWSSEIIDPHTQGVRGYHDVSPRVGAAYDVFGNGKTAVRFNVGHYLSSANNEGNYTINNPANGRITTIARTWTDHNGNFEVDCDILGNPAAHGECGVSPGNAALFGSAISTRTVNQDVLEGWRIRPWDWQTSASIQQELIPRLSVEFGVTRRWWGNFFVDDDLNLDQSHFYQATFTAPLHPDLPNGGGYPVTVQLRNASPVVNNFYTFQEDYAKETRHYTTWNVTANARTQWGLTLQGGTTTGRANRDRCDVIAHLPELAGGPGLSPRGHGGRLDTCSFVETWKTTLRGLATYRVPVVDVLVSGVMRSQPGAGASGLAGSGGDGLAANYLVSSEFLQTSATCTASTGAPMACPALLNDAANISINLLAPGTLYQKRLNTFDMRFAKVVRFGGQRADIGIDLYNIINDNTQTGYDQAFGTDGSTWLDPTSVRAPRFLRFNVTYTF